nr:VIT family protein [Corynebacterium lactis]
MTAPETTSHPAEPHRSSETSKLNWLRAGVLGANDGIVSTALVLLSVIAAGSSRSAILTAGAAAVIAGAISMALGEYVSVSTQRDTERALIAKEHKELRDFPEEEHAELVGILSGYGIPDHIAEDAARGIEANDPLSAHLRLELGIDGEDLTNPWAAAFSSAVAFILGAILPMVAALLSSLENGAIVVTVVTIITLALTGFVSAKLSETHSGKAAVRLVVGGALGLAVSYGIGLLFGAAVA